MSNEVEYETYYDEYGDLRRKKIKNKQTFATPTPFSRLEIICIACLVVVSIGVICLIYLTYQNIQFNNNLQILKDSITNVLKY